MREKKGKRFFAYETVGDETVDVYIKGDGRFQVTYKDHELLSETLGGVLEAVKRKQRVKKTKVAIPATWHSTRRHSFNAFAPPDRDRTLDLVDVELTGVHGRTNEVLFRIVATGKSETARGYSSTFYKRMTADEKKTFVALEAAASKAENAFRSYKGAREIQAARLIAKKVREIEETAAAPEGKKKR
jgi:hypothetical protein